MIVRVAHHRLSPRAGRTNKRLRIDDDKYIKELAELPRLIHKHWLPGVYAVLP